MILDNLILTRPLIFFDIESTGVDIVQDKIVELCMIKYFPDKHSETYVERFNPGKPIPKEATDVHGISDDDVKDKASFISKAAEVVAFLKGSDLSGYNIIKFDVPMLTEELLRAGIREPFESDVRYIDAYRIFTAMEKRDLSSALKFYTNQTLQNAHSAEADTSASAAILNAQVAKYNINGDIDALVKLSGVDTEIIDYDGKFSRNEKAEIIFTFGTNRGKRVCDNEGMLKWMLDKDFSQHTKYIAQKLLNKELQ